MWDTLIRNGQCVMRDGVKKLDLAIEDGKIVDISAEIHGSSREEIDASGQHIFPGVIDPHVHFNEPGRTEWEGFATGSAALAAGGGTCFFDMPLNSSPPTLDGPSFDLKLEAAKKSSLTDFALWGGLTPKNLDSMEELAERGVIGFKAFMSESGIDDFERADDYTLYKGMKRAAKLGLPVAVHAESDVLTTHLGAAAKAEGRIDPGSYIASRPIIAEVEAIRRAIVFAQDTGCSLHIVHISSAWGSMEVVESRHLCLHNQAGAGPVRVTGETCPHYLALTQDDVVTLGASAKCAPPLRSAQERERLWQQLLHGGIDMVASDHSPAPASMKTDRDFFNIWGGISGVQSTRGILLTRDPPLSLELVSGLTATNAANRFGLDRKGQIEQGFDADLALVDVDTTYTLTRDMLLDRHKLSPYVGRQFRGLVKRTISRGQTIFLDGKIVGEPRGKLIAPGRKERA